MASKKAVKKRPSLAEAALSRLDQRDLTKKQLRTLLERRAREEESSGDTASGDTAARVDAVIERLEAAGLVNDERFAQHFARGARQRGASQAKVQHKLQARGVARTAVDEALAGLAQDGFDELHAARIYVKKRRLTERYDLSNPSERNKALASLARQGFAMSIALAALETEPGLDVSRAEDRGPED